MHGTVARPVADGLVYHARNHGNNRDAVFTEAGDFQAFLDALAETKERYPLSGSRGRQRRGRVAGNNGRTRR